MDLVGRWWNGIWGRSARRDVWLHREIVWHVRAREGDSETGHELHWRYHDERAAREMVDRLLAAEGPGDWRDLTEVSRDADNPRR